MYQVNRKTKLYTICVDMLSVYIHVALTDRMYPVEKC